ncbi:MAG: ABC transporter ATP-binding protein [Pseudomonadota bacterium]
MVKERLFEIENISFSYNGKRALKDLSLGLDAGRFYGIVGPNGCGKTTLIDLIIHHRKPDQGRIRYRGKGLSHYTKKALSREIALVPQNFYINFPFTAGEVVMMGRYPHIPRFSAPSDKDIQMVRDIMEKTETLAFEHRYVTRLSGGERQRVIFARALAQDAQVLVLDEATSNLDIRHGISLMKIAARRVKQEKKTVISVMQDINLAAFFCDHLLFLSDGKVAARGPVEEVLNPETLRAVFGVESKVVFEPYLDALQVIFKK